MAIAIEGGDGLTEVAPAIARLRHRITGFRQTIDRVADRLPGNGEGCAHLGPDRLRRMPACEASAERQAGE
jgi:hypothetical protein